MKLDVIYDIIYSDKLSNTVMINSSSFSLSKIIHLRSGFINIKEKEFFCFSNYRVSWCRMAWGNEVGDYPINKKAETFFDDKQKANSVGYQNCRAGTYHITRETNYAAMHCEDSIIVFLLEQREPFERIFEDSKKLPCPNCYIQKSYYDMTYSRMYLVRDEKKETFLLNLRNSESKSDYSKVRWSTY